jgi:YidC/Oxa1 family membrane protein insertase
MTNFFHTILFQPLFNALIFFYNTAAFGDIGIAIIILTIAIRFILYPLFRKSLRYQALMQRIQPKLKEIQEKHKQDKAKQTEAMLALYKEHQVNPFSGFLLLLVQLPILIVLYRLFFGWLNSEHFSWLYPFIHAPKVLNLSFLGLINLNGPSMLMVVAAAIAQYAQGRLSLPRKKKSEWSDAERMSARMLALGPVLTVVIFARLPSAVSLYWLTTSLFSVVQQIMVNRELSNGTLGTIHKNAD